MNIEKMLNAFWLAMIEIYGKRWVEEHGENPGAMWKGALVDVNPERIKAAIMICRDSGDQHPINLPTFMKRIRSVKLEQPEQKALPAKPPSQEQQKKFHKFTQLRSGKRGKVRSIVLNGESWNDYKSAMADAIAAGKTMFQFKWERLNKNGWTIEDERSLYNATRACHYPLYNGTTNLLQDVNE